MNIRETLRGHPWFFLVLFLLVVLLATIDFSRRIFVPESIDRRVVPTDDNRQPNFSGTPVEAEGALKVWFPPKAPPPPPERKLVLRGVFEGRDRSFAAIAVVDPQSGAVQLVRVAQGEVVEGWTLKKVEKKTVELERAGEVKQLVMFPGRS